LIWVLEAEAARAGLMVAVVAAADGRCGGLNGQVIDHGS